MNLNNDFDRKSRNISIYIFVYTYHVLFVALNDGGCSGYFRFHLN